MSQTKKSVDVSIDILYAGVGDNRGRFIMRAERFRSLDENSARILRLKASGKLPREDFPAEVVDYAMKVEARTVEKFDDGDVDMPVFVRLRRTYTLFRALGVVWFASLASGSRQGADLGLKARSKAGSRASSPTSGT